MIREQRAYDPPKPRKDHSGFVIRTATLALLAGAAALIGVYVMNTPAGDLTPPSDQVSQLRAPPQFRSFEETADEASPADETAPATSAPAPAFQETDTPPIAPQPIPVPEAPPRGAAAAGADAMSPMGVEDGAR